MSKIINLITHSYYSFLQSTLSLEQIVDFAVENNCEYASLIDINVLYGAIPFYKLCLAKNIKPIIGIQIKYQNSDLALIAKNYLGYQKLLKISSHIMTNQNYDLNDYLSDEIFIIKINGEFTWNSNNYYTLNEDKNSIACNEVFYKNGEYLFSQILNAIKNNQTIDISHSQNITNENNKLLTPNEIKSTYNSLQVNNLENLVSQINLVLPTAKDNNIIKYPNTNNMTSSEYLNSLALNNLNNYLNINKDLNKEEYLSRLNYELDIINSKNFSDYFLVVYDFINWAKKNNIMIGPGRGSAAGSLVSFCLDITEIDPIKYNLLFERFLNINRLSLPDIDSDVMDVRRDELINYLFKKYGFDHVCHIITFSRIKAKQAIRDIGRVLNINLNIINKICKNIKSDVEEDLSIIHQQTTNKNIKILQEEYLQNKLLFDFAQQLINFPRQAGTHAAGIILSNDVITNVTAIQSTLNNKIMCQTSMEYLEELGLIKIDILGLRNLTIINKILKLIKHTKNVDIDLKKIDLNDQKVFKLFQLGNTNGIFQFESPGMKNTLVSVQPKSIEDLSLVSAIYRPGANENIDLYLKNKKLKHIDYLNYDIEKILSKTYGIIVYQEQIIKLVEIIANFDKFKADNFRKAISKKKENIILETKKEFLDAAVRNNYTLEQASNLFELILKFASYGFNHSHSLAYAFISYWLAYLKCYYPLESMSVFLSYGDNNSQKLISYLLEAKDFNIKIKNPNINLSSTSFVLVNNQIIFSLTSIASLGEESAKKIIELRQREDKQMFTDAFTCIAKLNSNGISKAVLVNLIKAGAFDELEPNRHLLLENIDVLTDKKINILSKENKFLFDLPINQNVIDDKNLYFDYEKEVLSIGITPTKINELFNDYQKEYHLVNLDSNHNLEQITTLIQVHEISEKTTKTKQNYLVVNFNQNNLIYSSTIFNDIEFYKQHLVVNNYYIVKLKYSNQWKNLNLIQLIKEIK